MGLNVSGIAIDNNFGKDIHQLAQYIGQIWQPTKDVSFRAATSFKSGKWVDVYFTEKGVLLFNDNPFIIQADNTSNKIVLSFGILEIAESYTFELFSNGSSIRSMAVSDGEMAENEGDALSYETHLTPPSDLSTEDIDELSEAYIGYEDYIGNLIWAIVGDVIGEDIWKNKPTFQRCIVL